MQDIVSEIKPKVSLEVGLAFGISSLWILEALDKTARHILIDPDQFGDMWQGIGLLNLERAGYKEQIEFHPEPSHTVLPRLEASGVEVDLAFIDGFHTFDHVLVDFFYVDKLLKENAMVVFDDVCYPSINKVIRFILTNRSYSVHRYLEYPELLNGLSWVLVRSPTVWPYGKSPRIRDHLPFTVNFEY